MIREFEWTMVQEERKEKKKKKINKSITHFHILLCLCSRMFSEKGIDESQGKKR
jgi:hypothetical protein